VKKIIGSALSGLYRMGLVATQASYRMLPFRIKKVDAKVISVGNITWGGTGKTPLTAKIAKDLAYYGKKVAVLTRGYGNDEVEELKKKLPDIPVLVGRDRVKTAREAVEKYQAEFLVLDDGFQHLRLERQLDIVNINSVLPFGPGGLIPAGTLREPLESLSRADIFILTKSNLGAKNLPQIRQKLLSIKPNATIFEAVHKPLRFLDIPRNRQVGLHEMKNRRVAVISAIADPFSFEKTVENVGAEIVLAARFDDHYEFTQQDLTNFVAQARSLGAREVITTEKDFFRIEPHLKNAPELATYNFLALEIEFQINDEEDFIRRCLNPQRG